MMLTTHHGALGLMEVDIALVSLVTGDAVIWANLVIIKLKQHAMRDSIYRIDLISSFLKSYQGIASITRGHAGAVLSS